MSRAVAVFGSSEPADGDPLYALARATGLALAERGFTVLTGGYGGVMEAACRGAREAGGQAVGVTVSPVFGARDPNPFLSETRDTADLYDRTRELVDGADAYVVVAGKAGTLAELAWVWALARAGSIPPRPVVALGDPWDAVLDLFEERGMLDPVALEMTARASTADQAAEIVARRLAGTT